MGQLEKEMTEIPCPGGGRSIRTTYGDLARKSSLKSSKGHEYKFKHGDQSRLRRSMDKIERLKKELGRKVKFELIAEERVTELCSQHFIGAK